MYKSVCINFYHKSATLKIISLDDKVRILWARDSLGKI